MTTPNSLQRCFNIQDLAALARRRLPQPVWDYLDGGADDEVTLRRNVSAFDRYELLPRYLVDVERIDMKTTVLGCPIDWPVFLSPTSMARYFHADGEPAVARVAAKHGTMYGLSTMATTSIEDVAASSGGPKLFQIYVLRDRALMQEFIDRCRKARYQALCLTVDVPVGGNRERDLRSGMTLPPTFTAASLLQFARAPGWCWDYLTSKRIEFKNVGTGSPEEQLNAGSLIQFFGKQMVKSLTWKDVEWIAQEWGGPFAVKGLMTADDARRAADSGATAVMVSNHGGRQLDGAPAPIDQIAEIVQAVGGRLEVILDGGVRRGTHVLKALALGARACSIGRGYLFGLAAAGEAGVDRALTLLKSEIERDLVLLGCRAVRELGPGFIRQR